jgi:mannose-6-phosphate isomerase-like protein (cupin superfamily)
MLSAMPQTQTHHDVPTSLWTLGCHFTLRHRSPDLEVIDALVPAGYSPPLHQHNHVSESFYVLEGQVRFVVGDSDALYGPGDFVHVPRSTPHSFETLGPLRALNVVAPAGLWRFFTECGEPAPEPTLPPEVRIPADLAAIVARHHGHVLGPPLNR